MQLCAGDRYEFTADSIGTDAGRVDTGTIVTVREVVAASTPGAHDDSEEAVVVEWVSDQAPRAWAVSCGAFSSLFTRVKE